MSSPDSRHSRNIAARPSVAITVFDTHAPIGQAEALYLEATAGPVDDHAQLVPVELLNTRLPTGQQLGPDDLGPAGRLRVYQANVTRHSRLARRLDSFSRSTVVSRQRTSDTFAVHTDAAVLLQFVPAGDAQREEKLLRSLAVDVKGLKVGTVGFEHLPPDPDSPKAGLTAIEWATVAL